MSYQHATTRVVGKIGRREWREGGYGGKEGRKQTVRDGQRAREEIDRKGSRKGE